MAFSLYHDNEKKNEKEPKIDMQQQRKKELEDMAEKILGLVIDDVSIIQNNNTDEETLRAKVEESILSVINDFLTDNRTHLSVVDKQKISELVKDEIFGYGPITSLLHDASISEIMVNGADSIYIEKSGKIIKVDNSFRDDTHVMHIIDKIVAPIGRRIDESVPLVDARLPDGSRVNIIIPPLALKGPTITIRKFSADPYTIEDLIAFGTLSTDMAKFLKASVRGRINIIVAGGTGSGKTTLLNVLSSFIPPEERIVTIEDAAELQLKQDHVVTLESRPANIEGKGKIGIRELVVNSLRMRPDRIIVGEVRSGEALDMLQAMNTGHDGSITTVHANSPRDTMSRIETMVMMSGMELPSRAIREQISSAVNLIVQIARFPDGSRKVSKITEITGMEGSIITLQDLFSFEQSGFDDRGKVVGKHKPTGIMPGYLDKLKDHGEILPSSVFKSQESMKSDEMQRGFWK